MSKYSDLTRFLNEFEQDGSSEWRASFGDIEEMLGQELPYSARQHRPWWANQGRAHSLAWEEAGWKTTNVDLENESVTFVLVEDDNSSEEETEVSPLSIAEAKAGLAAFFKVPENAIEITIRA